MNKEWLIKQLRYLASQGFNIKVYNNFRRVVIEGLELQGDGWTDFNGNPIRFTSVMIDLPEDFPMSVPGVGFAHPNKAIHIPAIKYNGKPLKNLYECQHKPWRWLCFQKIVWDPQIDNLITLLQIIEKSIYDRRQ